MFDRLDNSAWTVVVDADTTPELGEQVPMRVVKCQDPGIAKLCHVFGNAQPVAAMGLKQHPREVPRYLQIHAGMAEMADRVIQLVDGQISEITVNEHPKNASEIVW